MSSNTAPPSHATTKTGGDGSVSNPLSDGFHPAGFEDQSNGDSAQSSTRSLLSTVVISPQHSQGDLPSSSFKLAIPNHTTPTTARQYVSVTDNGTVAIKMPKIITTDNAPPKPVSVRELNKILVESLPPAAVAAIQEGSRKSSPAPSPSTPDLSQAASRDESHHQMLLRILSNASAQGIDINSLIAEVESGKCGAKKGGGAPSPAVVKPTKLHNGDEDVFSENDEVADLIPPIIKVPQGAASNLLSAANESDISASFGHDMTLPAVGSPDVTTSASIPTSTSATGGGQAVGVVGSPPMYIHTSSPTLHNGGGGSRMGSVTIDGLGSMHNNNDSFSHSSLQTNTFQARSMYTGTNSVSVNNTTTQMSSTNPGTGSTANTGGGSMNTGGGITYVNGSAVFGSPHGGGGAAGASMSMMDSMVVQGASMNSLPFPSMSNTNLSANRGNTNINHNHQSNNTPCPLDQFHPVQFHNAPNGASSGGVGGGMLPSVGLEMNSNNNLSTVSAPGISASSRNAEGPLSMQQSMLSPLSPFQQQPFSYNPTPASQTMISSMLHQPNDSLNVLSKDRTMLLIIPRQLIDPTEGSAAYDSQVSSHDTHHLAFKFRLCKLYEEGCPQGANCVFIHSCHVLDGVPNPDNTLPPSRLQRGLGHLQVVENDVHFNAAVTGKVVEHPTLPPGRVFDLKIGRPGPARSGQPQHPKMVSVPSEHVLVTKASRAYFYNELNAPKVPQACSHFERACCARGSACGFIHRLVIPSSQSSATNAPTTTSSTSMPRFEDMSSSMSSHNNNSHSQLPPPPPPHPQASRGGYNQRHQQQQQQPMTFNYDPNLAGMLPPGSGGGQQYPQQPQMYNFQPQHHHQQNVLYGGARPFNPANSHQQFQHQAYQQQQMYAAGGQPALYQQQPPTAAPSQFAFRGMN